MKKKISLFLFIILFILSSIGVYLVNSKPIFYDYAISYEVYLFNGSMGVPQKIDKESNISPFVCGEGCVACIDDIEKFFSEGEIKIIFVEEIEGGINYYGYSKKIRYRKNLDGEIINIQVYKKGNYIKIGSPMIYGSY